MLWMQSMDQNFAHQCIGRTPSICKASATWFQQMGSGILLRTCCKVQWPQAPCVDTQRLSLEVLVSHQFLISISFLWSNIASGTVCQFFCKSLSQASTIEQRVFQLWMHQGICFFSHEMPKNRANRVCAESKANNMQNVKSHIF